MCSERVQICFQGKVYFDFDLKPLVSFLELSFCFNMLINFLYNCMIANYTHEGNKIKDQFYLSTLGPLLERLKYNEYLEE